MIDLDMMPPDWKFAQDHAKANKPGLTNQIFTSDNVICPCCLKQIIKKQVPLLNNSKLLEFMGFGFPLYFIFIKYCIILLLILICSYSAISVYLGIQQTKASCAAAESKARLLAIESSVTALCDSIFTATSRINSTTSVQQIILRITSFILHFFALIYIRDNINKTMSYYDEKTTSLSDFSLIIKNLPLRQGIQKSIKDFIQNHFKDKWQQLKHTNDKAQYKSDQKVAQITLLPEIDNYYKLVSQKHHIIEEKRKQMIKYEKIEYQISQNPSPSPHALQDFALLKAKIRAVNERICLVDQHIAQISFHLRSMAKQDILQSEISIVTFTTQVFKEEVLEAGSSEKFTSKTVGQYFGDFQGELIIQKAPEPNEIIWQNANCSTKKAIASRVLSWFLSFVFIIVVAIIFYFLLLQKTDYLLAALKEEQDSGVSGINTHHKIALFLEYFCIFAIIFFNKFVMGYVLHFFTHHEHHFSTADQQFSFSLKYTLGMFFTTALMTLAVEAVTYHNIYQHDYGVVQEEFIIFILNALFIPLIWAINPWQINTLVNRYFKKNKKGLTQRQANQLMCDTPYTMGKRYAQIIKTMWFTFLYATLIPIGGFFSVLGLIIYYWVDKYNLLRKSSLPHNISGDLTILSLKMLDFTLVLKPAGQLIFDYIIRKNIQVQSIVLTFIGGVYLILPIDDLLEFFHRQDFLPVQQTYNEVKDTFLETYQTMHPLLSFKALKIFEIIRRKSSKQITMNEISVTLEELSPRKQSPHKNYSIDSKRQFPETFMETSIMQSVKSMKSTKSGKPIKQRLEQELQQQYLDYEYRSKINKSASKNYFGARQSNKKEHEVLPPFIR